MAHAPPRNEAFLPAVQPRRGEVREAAVAVAIVAAATLAVIAIRNHVPPPNLAMVYLLGVVGIATRCRRRIAVAASFLSVAAFDFFCVHPYLSFRVSDYQYLITFTAMLVVALVISTQTARIRSHAAAAMTRESRAETLYGLSRDLAGLTRVFDVARVATTRAEALFHAPAILFLPEDGRISFARRSTDRLPVPRSEEEVAQWVFDHGEKAGRGTPNFPGGSALYLPLMGATEMTGVLALLWPRSQPLAEEEDSVLEMFAHQAALAIERTRSQAAAESARVRMHTEEMRSSLLSAVSHDLRTPLASITGAASTLRSQGDKLEPATRGELLDSIAEEAERLERLVGNILDMTRLESGVELRRELCPIEEIVGSALQRLDRQLEDRPVITSLPESLPAVMVDDVLVGQVLLNLLENALKYTPPCSPIEISAEPAGNALNIEIRDRGPGVLPGEEARIFEKFYRGNPKTARGAGLGLAISRAIVAAHGGTIEVANRPGGGAIFRIRLPLEDTA
jgi:two-component system, OmpR family, sensor histidine kinase KdpD